MKDKVDYKLKQELFLKLIPRPQTDPPALVKAGHELFNQIIKALDESQEKSKENGINNLN